MSTTTPAVATTDARTPTERNRDRVAELEFEKLELESDKAADPVKYADDLNAWHARDTRRQQRLVEIEGELRERAEWGHLVDTAPDAVRAYARVSRATARRWEKVIENGTLTVERSGEKPTAAAREWWTAWVRLTEALPDDDHARNIAARELDPVHRFLVCAAMAEWKNAPGMNAGARYPMPGYGIDGWVPGWLRFGVIRTDKLAGDA